MKQYRYSLGRLAGRCPQCGRKTFKYYIDNKTGKIVDEGCGRCNRQVKCGYHATPHQFLTKKNFGADAWTPPRSYEPPPTSFIPERFARQRHDAIELNNLFRFLCRHFLREHLREVFAAYGVTHALFCGNAAAFWLRDSQGRLRSAKVMAYDAATGKRRKDITVAVSYAHALLRLPKFNYRACFFGEHLAAANPQSKIIVVESEKTALVLAAAIRASGIEGYVAVASGGASAMNINRAEIYDPEYRCSFLRDRCVILIPDADMVDAWLRYAETLRLYAAEVHVVDPRSEPFNLTASQDIADYILSQTPEPPDEW